MARLIDAERLSEHKYVGVEYDRALDMGIPASANNIFAFECGWNDALDSVERFAPTVDAVEVVRCKDCKWSCWNNCECIRNRLYRHNSISLEGEPYFRKIEPDDFCSWGERRVKE